MKPHRLLVVPIIAIIASFNAYSQKVANVLISFKPGEGQNSGQSVEYFPQNAFNLPITAATELVPSTAPENVVSLGLDGEIVLGFKDTEIIDGDGPDITVFENVFKNPINGKMFIEPGQVSVSEDGINFVSFPFDSLTLKGCAGVTPTIGSADPFDPKTSGGDHFDLRDLGLSRVKYVKIKDISRFLRDDEHHPYHDFTISGFDLDAVVALHTEKISSAQEAPRDFILENGSEFILRCTAPVEGALYNISGMELEQFSGEIVRIDKNKYPSQALILIIKSGGEGYRLYKIII